jgi:type I restriction enzyme S subunit
MINEEELPENWDVSSLSELGKFQNGKYLPKKDMVDEGEFAVFGSNGIIGQYDEYWIEDERSIIIGRVGSSGAINRPNGKIWATDNSIVFWPNDNINDNYLEYFLRSYNFEPLIREASQPLIRQGDVKEINVPVPPLDEQERVVDVVKERLDRMERLNKSVGDISGFIQEYKKSVFSFLTLGKNINKKHSVSGVPEQQNIPNGWNVAQLSKVADINPTVSHSEKENHAYVPMDAVSAEKKSITRYERRESLYSGLAKFSEGDIILARITPCFENGKMAMVSNLPNGYDSAVGSTEFVVVRPTNINAKFLFSYLKSPIVRQWGKHRLLGATGRERIKISQFRNELTVPIPPKETQSQIAQKIRKNDFSEIRASVTAVQNLVKEYNKSVLSHATKGEI